MTPKQKRLFVANLIVRQIERGDHEDAAKLARALLDDLEGGKVRRTGRPRKTRRREE